MSSVHLEPSALPSKNPLRSFWLSEPSELADHRTTGQLPKEADVIIVGSGIAGSLTAYNLLDVNPKLNIVMLEAREVCGGATGRNGGQIKTDPYIACERRPCYSISPSLTYRPRTQRTSWCGESQRGPESRVEPLGIIQNSDRERRNRLRFPHYHCFRSLYDRPHGDYWSERFQSKTTRLAERH